jgi:hypothetical protein
VTRVAIRGIAALVLVVMSGLPAAAVFCAHVCTASRHAAGADAPAHCHESDPADTTTMRAARPDGCDPFGGASLAMRERIGAPSKGVLLTTPALYVRHTVRLGDLPVHPLHPTLARSGLSPGASQQLRI